MRIVGALLVSFVASASLVELTLAHGEEVHSEGSNINVEPVNYTHDGDLLQGYVSFPPAQAGGLTFPALVFVPDWDGVNEYEQIRATMAAEDFGYVGFAADIYGIDLHQVENMTQRIELATFWRNSSTLFAERIQAAVDLVRTFPQVDGDNVAIAGYCLGGTGVLAYGLLGLNDVKAIVSYHGGLTVLPAPSSDTVITPKMLVLSGGANDTSTDVMNLEATLNSANASWEITRYSDIVHGFTVFGYEGYNEWADERSWMSTRTFLSEAFGQTPFESFPPDAVKVEAVPYTDVDGTELQGYLARPGPEWQSSHPAVVILPDWDGVNQYEQLRATKLAEIGYVAFAADIYGANLQDIPDMDTRMNLTAKYRDNMDLFVQRIERAMEQVKSYDFVDTSNVAVIGYCFGGTGIIQLAFSGNSDAKVVVSFHGGLTDLPNVTTDIMPYTLIVSGGEDFASGNQTVLEAALNGANSTWEITRYAGVEHGYTVWDSEAFSLTADARSWESMLTVLSELMVAPANSTSGGDSSGGSSTSSRAPCGCFSMYTTLALVVLVAMLS